MKDKSTNMVISYKRLWHLLIDRDISKSTLMREADLCWGTLSKLNRGENVNTAILLRICTALQCNIGDIMDILPAEERQ